MMRLMCAAAAATIILCCFTACSSPSRQQAKALNHSDLLRDRWGVEVGAIRLTGEQHFVDFRYWVRDPQKAAALLKRDSKAFLIDEATGKALPVMSSKLGPLRSTAVEPKAGRQYTILFSNTPKTVRKGSRVTVVIGDCRVEHLTVE